MRVPILFAVAAMLASAQPRDAAFQASDRAYTALRARDYDVAVPAFLAAIQAAPARADIRKDLAYTLLKIGEPTLARHQFREAMRLDPAHATAAVEDAFLCYETQLQAEAPPWFDRPLRTRKRHRRAGLPQYRRPAGGRDRTMAARHPARRR